jgi:hypothetical protein
MSYLCLSNSILSFAFSFPRLALPNFAAATPIYAKPPPRTPYLCRCLSQQCKASATHGLSSPKHRLSKPSRCRALLGYTFLCRCSADQCRCCSWLRYAFAFPFPSKLRQSISLQISAPPCHSHSGLGRAAPSPRNATTGWAVPLHFLAVPFTATAMPDWAVLCPCESLRFFSSPRQCRAVLCHIVSLPIYALAGLCCSTPLLGSIRQPSVIIR